MLEDIAVLTGGKPLFKDLGVKLDATTPGKGGATEPTVLSYLGRAKKVRIDAENSTITEGFSIFSATTSSSSRSCALYTTPMPPAPSSDRMR